MLFATYPAMHNCKILMLKDYLQDCSYSVYKDVLLV